jgi:acyl-CoA synthetase (AMP-forming)/AMP-acid ligase II
LGGDGFSTRVRDGLLEIKADSAMLGYLDEASPFTADGWLRTGDRVEVRGDYFRILGRASDLIVVGGEKVYPAEVEDHLLALPGVVEAVVFGEPNALTGQAVVARVRLSPPESRRAFRDRMRPALAGRIAEFKVPVRVEVSDAPLHAAQLERAK